MWNIPHLLTNFGPLTITNSKHIYLLFHKIMVSKYWTITSLNNSYNKCSKDNYQLSATTAVTQLHNLLYQHIPMVKLSLKLGTSGKNPRVFEAHFDPLKGFETGYNLTPTMANI